MSRTDRATAKSHNDLVVLLADRPAAPVVRDPSPTHKRGAPQDPSAEIPATWGGAPKRAEAEPGSPADNGRGRKNAVTSPLKDA
jgi:hypothetical protein